MAPEDLRDLARVMEIVLQDVPDHPLAREGLGAGAALSREVDVEIVRRPAPKAVLDHRPRRVERLDDLGCAARVILVVLPPRVLEREIGDGRAGDTEHVTGRRVALAEDVVEPLGAARAPAT